MGRRSSHHEPMTKLERRAAARARKTKQGYGEVIPFVRPETKSLKPLNDKQSKLISLAHTKTLTFATGCAGTGKAQPLDALVKTPNGWVSMGDILPGSIVSTPDGGSAQVTAVYPQGEKDIYRIIFEDGRWTECCKEHLWRVYFERWSPNQWRVISLTDIVMHAKKSSFNDRLYIELPSPENRDDSIYPLDPYILGVILGDGSVSQIEGGVNIAKPDTFIREEIGRLLPEGLCVGEFRKDKLTFRINGREKESGKSAEEILSSFGLMGSVSYTKFIPAEYLKNSSASQKWSLLQGLMDTDGTVDDGGSSQYCTTSPVLAEQVQYLVRSLGGLCKIRMKKSHYTYKDQYKEGRLAYILHIRVTEPRNLFRLPRKKERTPENYQYAKSLRLRIKDIKYVGKREAQCISIDHPDHLYITDDYIVTHNTHCAIGVALQKLEKREIDRIVLTKPDFSIDTAWNAVPGDENEKFAHLFRPMREIFTRFISESHLANYERLKKIKFDILGNILGLTYDDAFVIIDEAQCSTPGQMKALLTRLGKNTSIVVAGDYRDQKFIAGKCGLEDALTRLGSNPHVGRVNFTPDDIVRSDFVKDVILAYRNVVEDVSIEED